MSNLSIKVNICGRSYPMSVKPEEEAMVRRISKMIDENINLIETKYAVRDKQDLLAMTALQLLTKKFDSVPVEYDQDLLNKLSEIEEKISSAL